MMPGNSRPDFRPGFDRPDRYNGDNRGPRPRRTSPDASPPGSGPPDPFDWLKSKGLEPILANSPRGPLEIIGDRDAPWRKERTMRLCLVEDNAVAGLEPLTLTRPASDLLLGANSLGSKIARA